MQKAVDRQTLIEDIATPGDGPMANKLASANRLSNRSAGALSKVGAAAMGALVATLLPWLWTTTAWASGMRAEALAIVIAASLIAAAIGYLAALFAARAHPHGALAMTALLSLAALSQMPFNAEVMIADTSAATSPSGLAMTVLHTAGIAIAALTASLVPRWSNTNHARATWTAAALVLVAYPLLIEPSYPLEVQSRIWMAAFVAGMILVAAADAIETRAAARLAATPPPIALSPQTIIHLAIPAAILPQLLTNVAAATAPLALPASLIVAASILVAIIATRRAATGAPSTVALTILASLVAATAMLGAPSAIRPVIGIAALLVAIYINGARFAHATPADALIGLALGAVGGSLLPHLPLPAEPLTLTLLAALCTAPGLTTATLSSQSARRLLAVALLATATAMIAATVLEAVGTPAGIAFAGLAVPLVLWLIHHTRFWHERNLALVAVVLAASILLPSHWDVAHVETSTWTTARLLQTKDATRQRIMAATTLIGREPTAVPAVIAKAIATIRQAKPIELAAGAAGATPLLIGIVGAASASACATAPGDVIRYFETDAAVAKLASDPRWPTTSKRCAPAARTIIGDPRRTLAAEPDEAFDLLVIDSGATAAPPLHLLTTDMLALVIAKLSPSGILALQVTRDHLDLAPWVAQQITPLRGVNAVRVGEDCILLSRNAAIIEQIAGWPEANGLERITGPSLSRYVPMLPALKTRSNSAF